MQGRYCTVSNKEQINKKSLGDKNCIQIAYHIVIQFIKTLSTVTYFWHYDLFKNQWNQS